LAPVKFYIRLDDPIRRQAGEMLAAQLVAEHIPVDAIITERTVCYKNVMVLYDYNLYTGGWSLTTTPDTYHDLYASFTYYGPSIGWSQNYPGFCNNGTLMGAGHPDSDGFDYWALKVKYPATEQDAIDAAQNAGYLFLKYCAIVPMYSTKAVKAYTKGWEGMVNDAGFGIDNNPYTILNAYNPSDSQLDYGFKSDIEQLNQVSSEWLWDQLCLGLMYESMLFRNPYNLQTTEFFLADSCDVGSWTFNGAPATWVHYHLRTNVLWHNATDPDAPGGPHTRRGLTNLDINFSFYYQYACGPGIAWNYPAIAQFYNTSLSGSYDITIFYKKQSYWARQWTGGLPIINPDTWSFVPPGMQAKTYDPAGQDKNGNGVRDLYEDGTGPYMYGSYNPGNWVTLTADSQYYQTQADVTARISQMFHIGAGDVNSDGVVNILDLSYMARALGSNPSNPGTGWGQYNVDCDLVPPIGTYPPSPIDYRDLAVVTTNYGRTKG